MIERVVQAERVYSVQEVAALIAVDPQTVRRWLRAGDLAGTVLGDKSGWRIVGADLIAFWEARSNRGGASRGEPS